MGFGLGWHQKQVVRFSAVGEEKADGNYPLATNNLVLPHGVTIQARKT
jgi:hypothetical protein